MCWAADSMADAIDLAFDAYYRENCLDDADQPSTRADERDYYEQQMLESCALLGELGNMPGQPHAVLERREQHD